ncbi:MAG: bifunctional DNase/RNase [Bermanella sp.]|jgi:hypothetical protein
MTLTRKQTSLIDGDNTEQHFQGAIIDENGREIPITHDMIAEACDTLEARRIKHLFIQKRSDAESNKRFS